MSLRLSPAQLAAIHSRLAGGARRASLAAPLEPAGVGASIARVALCPVSEFPARAIGLDHPHMTAAAVAGVGGALPATAIAVFEPRAALALIHRLSGTPARSRLERRHLALFVEAGRRLLEHLVGALLEGVGGEPQVGEARLVEDSLTGLLVRTHAPADAAVISARLRLELGERRLEGAVYGFFDSKRLPALAQALAGAE